MNNLTKINKIKLVEIALERCEKIGIENLNQIDRAKYEDLKSWFMIEAKKMRYI